MTTPTPTPKTRRQLREALAQAEFARNEAQKRADVAEAKLESLGYEAKVEMSVICDGAIYPRVSEWVPTDSAKIYSKEYLDESERWSYDLGRQDGGDSARDKALRLVLDALEIDGYDGDTRRFRADLETAIAVRTEQRKQEERERTEQRVRDILHPDYRENVITGIKGGIYTESNFPTAAEAKAAAEAARQNIPTMRASTAKPEGAENDPA